jgi:hypothetical protein
MDPGLNERIGRPRGRARRRHDRRPRKSPASCVRCGHATGGAVGANVENDELGVTLASAQPQASVSVPIRSIPLRNRWWSGQRSIRPCGVPSLRSTTIGRLLMAGTCAGSPEPPDAGSRTPPPGRGGPGSATASGSCRASSRSPAEYWPSSWSGSTTRSSTRSVRSRTRSAGSSAPARLAAGRSFHRHVPLRAAGSARDPVVRDRKFKRHFRRFRPKWTPEAGRGKAVAAWLAGERSRSTSEVARALPSPRRP